MLDFAPNTWVYVLYDIQTRGSWALARALLSLGSFGPEVREWILFLTLPAEMAEEIIFGIVGREYYEEHFCESILNLGQ